MIRRAVVLLTLAVCLVGSAEPPPVTEMFLVASPTAVERKHDAAFNVDLIAP
jgi:hypothetical protein